FDRAERERAVLRGLYRPQAQITLEGVDHLLRPHQRAREVRADLHQVSADWLEVEHVVEVRDRFGLGGREVERFGDLLQRLRREPAAVPRLGRVELVEDRRARVRVLPMLVQRSTSPITVSSEPTIAIRSATRAFDMQVAVASSATNEGARNLTRQGLGPPSETT